MAIYESFSLLMHNLENLRKLEHFQKVHSHFYGGGSILNKEVMQKIFLRKITVDKEKNRISV
jgi:hypothetical protein